MAFGLLVGLTDLASDRITTSAILLCGGIEGLLGYGAEWLVISRCQSSRPLPLPVICRSSLVPSSKPCLMSFLAVQRLGSWFVCWCLFWLLQVRLGVVGDMIEAFVWLNKVKNLATLLCLDSLSRCLTLVVTVCLGVSGVSLRVHLPLRVQQLDVRCDDKEYRLTRLKLWQLNTCVCAAEFCAWMLLILVTYLVFVAFILMPRLFSGFVDFLFCCLCFCLCLDWLSLDLGAFQVLLSIQWVWEENFDSVDSRRPCLSAECILYTLSCPLDFVLRFYIELQFGSFRLDRWSLYFIDRPSSPSCASLHSLDRFPIFVWFSCLVVAIVLFCYVTFCLI